jgi:hypothetical protein
MEPQPQNHTPPDCFQLEELQVLQSFEGQLLDDVNYYLWLNQADDDSLPYRFLYALECLFDNQEALLVSVDEESTALRIVTAETLVKTFEAAQALHGKISLQRVNAGSFPIWEPAVGRKLEAIRLTRGDDGLYLNDALLLDFGEYAVLVRLSLQEGVEVLKYVG